MPPASRSPEARSGAPPHSWTDAPVITNPPPFVRVETSRGPASVRRFAVPLPASLASALAGSAGVFAVDVEALGLRSEPIFLLGLARAAPGPEATMEIEQILAPDLAREGALLEHGVAALGSADRIATYNGRSYDLPLLRDRAARYRIRPPRTADVDLLPLARRRYRRTLPDCRLATMERLVLGRSRRGDVPGREIPRLYRESARFEEPALLAPVLHHNALDLLTTIELFAHLETATD